MASSCQHFTWTVYESTLLSCSQAFFTAGGRSSLTSTIPLDVMGYEGFGIV